MQKDNDSSYIEILRDSLLKKRTILEKISEQNKIQSDLAKAEKFDYDTFEVTLEVKESLIKEINELDSGFQTVYNRVKSTLETDREIYADVIAEIKQLISAIMDKSMDIMAEELRNKETIMNRKDNLKKEVTMARTTNKIASNYYKTMSKLNVLDSQFIDAKK